MAIISYPFVSVAGDRKYGPADIAAVTDTQWAGSDGVIQDYLNELEVTSLGSYQTKIATGGACFSGYTFQSNTDITLTHDSVAPGSKRYDLVVVTMDTVVSRNFSAGIVKGTASAGTPSVPSAGTFDTVLARLYIDNTTGTPAYTLVDLRSYMAVSGSNTSILAKVKEVDGASSGLDADLLDGQQGSYYLPASSYTASDVLTKIKTVDGAGSGLDADVLDGQDGSYYQNSSNQNAGTLPVGRLPALTGDVTAAAGTGELSIAAATVLLKLLTVDGAGSSLDADTVDGYHANSATATVSYGASANQGFEAGASNYASVDDGAPMLWRLYVKGGATGQVLWLQRASRSGSGIGAWTDIYKVAGGPGSSLDADTVDGYHANSATATVSYGASANQGFEIGAGNDSAVDNGSIYKWRLYTSGNNAGQRLYLQRNVRGTGWVDQFDFSTIWTSGNLPAVRSYNGGTVSGSATLPSINVGETMIAWYQASSSTIIYLPAGGTYNVSGLTPGIQFVKILAAGGDSAMPAVSGGDGASVIYTRIS